MAAEAPQPKRKASSSVARNRKGPQPKPIAWLHNPDGTLTDWRDPAQFAPKVRAEWNENFNKEIQPAEYIESRALTWVRELEHIGIVALEGPGADGPDYDLAAKIRLSLIKLSSVNRQRVDLTAQIAMTAGPDLSKLSDAELQAIELGNHEQLNELALRIGQLKSARPDKEDE